MSAWVAYPLGVVTGAALLVLGRMMREALDAMDWE